MASTIASLTSEELQKRVRHAVRLADEYFLQPTVRQELLAYANELEAELGRRGGAAGDHHPASGDAFGLSTTIN
jgi:hypothetical protein